MGAEIDVRNMSMEVKAEIAGQKIVNGTLENDRNRFSRPAMEGNMKPEIA